jgi:hypothetical protein
MTTRGLVRAFSLQDPSGWSIKDVWRKDFQMNLVGMDPATDWVADGSAYCLDFDGSNDYATILGTPVEGAMAANKTVSMSLWCKTSDTGTTYRGIFGLTSSTSNAPFWIVGNNTSGRPITLSVRNNAGGAALTVTGSIATNTDEWTHVYVSQSTASAKIYVNGRLDIETADTTIRAMTLNRVTLGAFVRVSAANHYLGRLSDCRLYNVTHTEDEIMGLYLRGRNADLFPVDDTGFFKFSAGPAFRAAWASRRPTLIGGGLC